MAVERIEDLVVHDSCKDNRPMTKEERADLKESMALHKRNVPIVVWRQGLNRATNRPVLWIVDGLHRYEVAKELGWKTMLVEEFNGTPEEAKDYAKRLNRARRHEPLGKLAIDAAKKITTQEGNQPTGSIEPVGAEEAAKAIGISVTAVKRAKTVLEHGTPELISAVESGEVKVSAAAKQVKPSNGKQRKRKLCPHCGKPL